MSAQYGHAVSFVFGKESHCGYIEKEYQNSYLICVNDPSPGMMEKYNNRMIVSKKYCTLQEAVLNTFPK